MVRGRLAAWLFVFALLPGCHHRAEPPRTAAPRPVASLPATEPASLQPVVHLTAKLPAAPPESYRKLTADGCQELAVKNSGLAQVLEPNTPAAVRARHFAKFSPPSARTLALGYAADEARNRSAAEALELYFQLAAAEGGVEATRLAEKELEELLDASRKATAAGFKEPADAGELIAQLADVRAESARLTGASRELNHGLKAALGLSSEPRVQFWPDAPQANDSRIDVDEAVRTGLHYRPDLLLLRSLLQSNDTEAPAVARQMLGGAAPLAAGPPGPALALAAACLPSSRTRDAKTMQQVADLLAARERQAEAEIRAAVDRVAALAIQTRLHADAAEQLKLRVEDLEKAKATGRDVVPALAKARAAAHKANGNLLKAVSDYQIAGVKLRQAQGLLVREVSDPEFGSRNR